MTADAARPRWRGQPGRLEVWYVTATDAATGTGLWLHHEMVAPLREPAYAHGWIAHFPSDGPPQTQRFGPTPVPPVASSTEWNSAAGCSVGPGRLSGDAGPVSWDLAWKSADPPLWTFPAGLWHRELLPAAQVVLAPHAQITGTITTAAGTSEVAALGNVAHIYGHGNAERWGWLHADLDDDTVLEIVAAVSRRPGLASLPPLAFVQLRRRGHDWPRNPLVAAPMFRTRLTAPTWTVRGVVGRTRLTVEVTQPADRCVQLHYVDPDGSHALCTNTERADVTVRLERWRGGWRDEQRWSLAGRAHAELGTRD
jgi:hypothetical protein